MDFILGEFRAALRALSVAGSIAFGDALFAEGVEAL